MIAYQDIPLNNTIQLGQSIIVDQGVAVGALIFLFIIVVLFIAVLWRVLGNQRQENKDQGVLVVTIGNLASIIKKFDETADRFADVVETNDKRVSNDRDAANQVIQGGVDKIADNTTALEEHTKGITLMAEEFNQLKTAIETAVTTAMRAIVETGVVLSPETQSAIVASLVKELKPTIDEMKSCVQEIKKTTTQEAPVIAEIKHLQETETKKSTQEAEAVKPDVK